MENRTRSKEITEKDVIAIEKTLDLFDWMTTFEIIGRNVPTIDSILQSPFELLEISRYYREGKLEEQIMKRIDSLRAKAGRSVESSA